MNTVARAGYEFGKTDTGYELITADGSVLINASRLRWTGEDLKGEVAIYAGDNELSPMSFVFTSASSRRELAGLLEDREVDKALNEMCRCVIEAERTASSPIVRLCDVPRPSPEREYHVPMLPPLPRSSMAIWFGDGGTGKSLLALYVAGYLARQGLRVLYLDWELTADDHRIRYEQLFGAEMPSNLHYWQCDRPLTQMTDSIRQKIRELKIEYVVVDSIAFACGGNAESSETAATYGLAARSFGVGSLHLAHVAKTGNGAKHKPFGSTFWHNAARSTWFLEASGTRKPAPDVTETTLAWHHRKSNFGPLEKDVRIVTFAVDRARDEIRIQCEQDKSAPATMSTAARLREVLRRGPQSFESLERLLSDVKPNTLRKTIQRELKKTDGKWLDEDAGGLIGICAPRPSIH